MATETGQLIRVTWATGNTFRREATLEVRHDDGSMTFLVVDVNRMSERIPYADLYEPDGTRRRPR